MNLDKSRVEKRIKELSEQINHHNHRYYTMSEPEISNYDFDVLLEELIQLESQFPDFADNNSPTKRVGGTVSKEFQTVVHRYPMMSLSNSYSKEEIEEFDKRVKKALERDVIYVCELKYDGVAIGIQYVDGQFKQAVTRGDGEKGDDISNNVRTIKTIPLKLHGKNFPKDLEIRGEIFWPLEDFERVNREREEIGEPRLANPRNAASGTLKMQDSGVVAGRQLDCYLYFLLGNELPTNSHYENVLKAKDWGFNIPLPEKNFIKKCDTLKQVFEFIDYWEEKLKKLNFNVDGVVIKVDDLNAQEELGFTAKSPRWAIAYKYKTERVSTRMNTIDFQVGRTGAITPVANLEPVLLAGTTVKRASLHNADQIKRLDLHLGDEVFVEKGGEIIPKIIGVDLNKRSADLKSISFIEKCPECDTKLKRDEGEVQHFCPNEWECPPQIIGKMVHFISRKAMDIDGLGEETIELLYHQGLIKNIADIYDLTKDDLLPLERMAEKSVENLLEGVAKSVEIPFNRVLFGLGIRFVGETVAKKLAKHFGSMDAIKKADHETLIGVDEIGDKIAQSIVTFFTEEKNRKLVERMKSTGLQMEIDEANKEGSSDKLTGKIFVVSGVFNKYSRDELKELIEQNGGKNSTSISAKTSYILAGENMGPSKLEKANKLGIPIINEEDFEALLK